MSARPLPGPPVLPAGDTRWAVPVGRPLEDWAGPSHALETPADRDGRFGRAPSTTATATALLHLIHRHRHGLPRGFSAAGWLLLQRQLAHYPPGTTGTARVLTPHPDVLFALDLTDQPDLGPEHAMFSDHDDR